MPAAKLLSELKSLGVELWPQDGQLKFRAPQGLLDTERLAQLREHKQQILHLLETQERPLVQADPAQHHTPFPLTDVQNAYLLGRQSSFGYGNVACHGYLELSWPSLDPQQVELAWNRLIARHDMLRAVIQASDDFARLSDPADRAFFLTESSPTGSRRWDALIAGLAVHLCRVGQMKTAPMWTTDPSFTLHDIWFVDSDAPTMRAHLMQQAIPSERLMKTARLMSHTSV